MCVKCDLVDSFVQLDSIHIFTQTHQLNIRFVCTDSQKHQYALDFKNVHTIDIRSLSFPMIVSGFEIIDHKQDGWDSESRFEILDYEDNVIHFTCENVAVL